MKAAFPRLGRWVIYGCCSVLLLLGPTAPGMSGTDTGADPLPFEAGLQLSPARPAPSRPAPMEEAVPGEWGDADEQQTLARSIRRIHRLMAEGDLPRARTELAVDLGVYPDEPILLQLAAILYTLLGEYERADHYWERVADPADDHEVLSMRGGVLLRIGDIEQAEEKLSRAYAEQPYQTPTVFHLVFLYAASERTDQAAQLLKAMSAIDLTQMMRWLYEDRETFVGALGVEAYRRTAELVLRGGIRLTHPDATAQAEGFLPLTTAGEDISDLFVRAEGESDQEIERLHEQLKRAHRVLTRFGNAIRDEQWEDAARIGTHPGVARLGLTAPAFRAMAQYARFRAGEEENAVMELQRLHNRFPDSLFPALRLAYVLMEQGEYQEAIEALNGMDGRYPRHALKILLRACALAEAGQPSQALERLQALDDTMQSSVIRWLAADAPYQQAILNDDAYATWRSEYSVGGMTSNGH